MKTINLFLKAHFTSLSPDGQFISLAIIANVPKLYYSVDVGLSGDNESSDSFSKRAINENLGRFINAFEEKSFYAEFSDFDINRCDDWVKENVISKLNINFKYNDPREDVDCMSTLGYNWKVKDKDSGIKVELSRWLSQFSDYKLNFIVDCGWFCWGKFVELMGKWDIQKENITSMLANPVYDSPLKAHAKDVIIYQKCAGRDMFTETDKNGINLYIANKVGLPKLPANFPPVPQDLNDLIALRIGISVSEAFELDRELLGLGFIDNEVRKGIDKFKEDELVAFGFKREKISDGKFNALWDAKITKAIYEKLI